MAIKQRRITGDANRARILSAIRELYREQHRPTTYREINQRSGVSMGSITNNLPHLENDGLIRRLPGMRGIEPVDAATSQVQP